MSFEAFAVVGLGTKLPLIDLPQELYLNLYAVCTICVLCAALYRTGSLPHLLDLNGGEFGLFLSLSLSLSLFLSLSLSQAQIRRVRSTTSRLQPVDYN